MILELNKIIFIKNKNVTHNHQIEVNVSSLLFYDQYVKNIE